MKRNALRGRIWAKIAPFGGILALSLSALYPHLANAQATSGATLGTYITATLSFINAMVIPLIVALAFLVFIWGLVKYFIISGANQESRDEGKKLALWGIITFVIVVSVWGLVNLFVTGLNIGGATPLCPDYNKNCGATGGSGTAGTPGGGTGGAAPGTPTNPYANISQPTSGGTSGGGSSGSGGSGAPSLSGMPALGEGGTIYVDPVDEVFFPGGTGSGVSGNPNQSQSSLGLSISTTDPEGGGTTFTFSGSNGIGTFNLVGGGSTLFTNLESGTYTIRLTSPSGWTLQSAGCGSTSSQKTSTGISIFLGTNISSNCTLNIVRG